MNIEKAELIANYLYQNYYIDGKRLSGIPIVAAMIEHASNEEVPSLIDKVAAVNGIKKSYPPTVEIVINA